MVPKISAPPSTFQGVLFSAGLLLMSLGVAAAQEPSNPKAETPAQTTALAAKTYPAEVVQQGAALFRQNCSFCHGRGAGGGESGPDLTRSKLVTAGVDGDKIGPVVRNGRPDKGMPHFDLAEGQIASLVAFIHTRQNNALT